MPSIHAIDCPDDQPFQIAQPHAPLPGGNGIAKLKDSPVGVVDAPDRGGGLTPSVFEQGALLQGERQRADPRDACEGRGVEIPLRKGRPCRGETVRSASKAEYIDLTSDSKPLKTDSRMIMAATGIATAATLNPEIRLTTDRDWDEKR